MNVSRYCCRRMILKKCLAALFVLSACWALIYWLVGQPAKSVKAVRELGGDWELLLQRLVPSDSPDAASATVPLSTNHSSHAPLIPFMFHQTYRSLHVPSPYISTFLTLLDKHRISHSDSESEQQTPAESSESLSEHLQRGKDSALEYRYVFWTDSSILAFIADRFPSFLPLFRRYSHALERADAVRYFIMYEFGGVYADLDVGFIRSLSPLLQREYPCLLGAEPPVQTAVLFNVPRSVSNALLLCRPRHPFFRLAIDSLAASQAVARSDPEFQIVFSTGPFFLQQVLERYQQSDP